MTEKITFEMSGLIKNMDNVSEIEFWGHDAGEFTKEEIAEILEAVDIQEVPEESRTT